MAASSWAADVFFDGAGVFLGPLRGGDARGHALQGHAHGADLLEVACRERPHAGPAAVVEFDQPVAFQGDQCLTNGRAAGAELFRQDGLGE